MYSIEYCGRQSAVGPRDIIMSKVQYNFSGFPDFVPLFFVLVQNAKNNSTKVIEFSLLVQRFLGLVQNYVPIVIGTKSSDTEVCETQKFSRALIARVSYIK